MIYIYSANLKNEYEIYEKNADEFEEMLSLLCEERRKKVDNMKQPKDKVRALAAGIILQSGLYDYLSLSAGRKDVGHRHEKFMNSNRGLSEDALFRAGEMKKLRIDYGKNEKPYLPEYPGIHFNISHSGDYVVVALSCHPVGIDIQQKRILSDALMEKYFTEKERNSGYEPFVLFSAKESYIKLTGEGMSRSFNDFSINLKTQTVRRQKETVAYVRMRELEAGEYALCICDKCKDIIAYSDLES